ncbi:MAG: hypothetical protein IJD95_01765 [Clostridia bacterium]|nr:hypothetical protein [Clostridia bacterium]
MKKKIFALVMVVVILAIMLTGCVQADIGVKINKDGTGSVAVIAGIEKSVYQSLKGMGEDPFKDIDPSTLETYTYEDTTYIGYTEITEYNSFEEIENYLLELNLDTEETGNKDNRLFSSVQIIKNGNIFNSSYKFYAVTNSQSSDMSGIFNITLTVEMPYDITEYKSGNQEGNKITFTVFDVTESQEFFAICESNNFSNNPWIDNGLIWGIIIGVVISAVTAVALYFLVFKNKKKNIE